MRICRRRHLSIKIILGLLVAFSGALVACASDEIGQSCGTDTEPLAGEIVEGETAVTEVVRMQRDSVCSSFQCLTHAGQAAYCTRSCTFEKAGKKAASCVDDSDCKAPKACYKGACREHDCPSGFSCGIVQDSGPLAGQLFCKRQTGCDTSVDCDDLDHLACRQQVCFDSCLLEESTTDCTEHRLTCKMRHELNCYCPNSTGDACSDADVVCQPESAVEPWPTSSVQQVGICLPKD